MIEMFTSSYGAFDPSDGVAVQASNGRPKWPLRYPLEHAARLITPPRSLAFNDKISDEEFGVLYRGDLDAVGVDRIAAELQGIAESAGDFRLVILCFESDPLRCHRSDFAKWWTGHTGDTVTELSTGTVWEAHAG